MLTKEQIKALWAAEKQAAIDAGRPEPRASINLANMIAACALFRQKLRDGSDYITHPFYVAGFGRTRSEVKQIIGLLHDVVEDSDWTIDDLREMGFEERVCRGVDAVTKREGENYFEFIERCGLSFLNEEGRDDAIDIKIEDLEHNSINTRAPHIFEDTKSQLKRSAYNMAYYYLVDIKKGKIEPGTRMVDWLASHPAYNKYPELTNFVLARFSDRPDRLPVPARVLAGAFEGTAPA